MASWAVVEFRDCRSGGFELKAVPKERSAAQPLSGQQRFPEGAGAGRRQEGPGFLVHIVQPDRDSGARRVFHFITFLREAGWDVTFLASDGIGDVCDAQRLQQMGIAVYDGQTDKIEELFSKSAFDVAVIAFWRNAERYIPALRRLSPATRIIVDSIDLHFVREIRQAFIGAEDGRLLDRNTDVTLAGELNAYAAADGILAVSDKETVLLNDCWAIVPVWTQCPTVKISSTRICPSTSGAELFASAAFNIRPTFRPSVIFVKASCRSSIPRS